jgi:predicted LPLAT superfamily acyltransferase
MSQASDPSQRRSTSWLETAEKGSIFGVRIVLLLCTLFGRNGARMVLHPIVLYYVLVHGQVRAASRGYLRRVFGRDVGFVEIYRHVLCFARVLVDRLFMLAGRDDLFRVSYTGHEHLQKLHDEKRGAVLLSAHIGSRSAMGLGQRARMLRINVVGYGANARMINQVLARFDRSGSLRMVELEPGSPASVLAIKSLIADGQMVAMAADRTGLDERSVRATFLGEEAAFSTGPFVLAALLNCPVYLVFALYRGGNRYELYCEPFVETMRVPRAERESAIREYVERYARRLEHYCRLAPDNWFNFYDFWGVT